MEACMMKKKIKIFSVSFLLTLLITNPATAEDSELELFTPVELDGLFTKIKFDGKETGFVFEVDVIDQDYPPIVQITSDEPEICQVTEIEFLSQLELIASNNTISFYNIYIQTKVLADSGSCIVTVERDNDEPIVVDYFYAIE